RPRDPPRSLPADRDLTLLDHRHRLRHGRAGRPHGELDRRIAGPTEGLLMTDDLGTVVLVSGAVGDPGQRVFYLQAQGPFGTHTVKCEKQQVAALAEHLERLLADLPPIGSTSLVPGDLQASWSGLDPRFVLGTIGLAYDAEADRVVVVLEELVP